MHTGLKCVTICQLVWNKEITLTFVIERTLDVALKYIIFVSSSLREILKIYLIINLSTVTVALTV